MRSHMEIDPHLASRLAALRDQPARDPTRAARGRVNFLIQVEQMAASLPVREAQAVSDSEKWRHSKWMHPIQIISGLLQRKEHSPMFSLVGTIVLIISLVVGGGGVTVAAAQNSLPDQPLYRIKTWSEDVRVGLTSNESSRLQLALEYANRRAQETQAMVQAGQTPPTMVQDRMQAEIDLALQLASANPQDQVSQALQPVCEQLQSHLRLLQQGNITEDSAASAALTQTRDMLQDRLRLCIAGSDDPDMLRKWDRDRLHATPSSQPQDSTPDPTDRPQMLETPTPGDRPGSDPGDGHNPRPMPSGTVTPGEGSNPPPMPTGTITPGEGPHHPPMPTGTITPGQGPHQPPMPTGTITPGEGPHHPPMPTGTITPGQGPHQPPMPTGTITPGEGPHRPPMPTGTITPGEGPNPPPMPTGTVTPGAGPGPGPGPGDGHRTPPPAGTVPPPPPPPPEMTGTPEPGNGTPPPPPPPPPDMTSTPEPGDGEPTLPPPEMTTTPDPGHQGPGPGPGSGRP